MSKAIMVVLKISLVGFREYPAQGSFCQRSKGNKYYLNCNSLVKWAERVKKQGYEIDSNLSSFVQNSKLVQNALESIKEQTQKKKTDPQGHPKKIF
ncbi:MAG: hypothetical protein HWD61_13550 [Parachlamydiaceae bacterium]|nr:MAG: hypothetical protein HWD61_13550 [Parachlamydiaceae bacterium]